MNQVEVPQPVEAPVGVQPIESVQPVVEDQVLQVNSLIDQPPVLVPEFNPVETPVDVQPIDQTSIMTPSVDETQNLNSMNNIAVLENNSLPQLDPTIPVVAPVVGVGVVEAAVQPESAPSTPQPDLLFSANNPQPTPELEPKPIPMDNSVQYGNYQYNDSQYQQQPMPQQTPINSENERLFRAFVGDNYYTKGKHSFFNIWGFLFGGLYVLYRKMYLAGIIIIVAQNLLINLLSINPLLVTLIFGSVVGLFFNILYTMHANMKINSIKRRYNSNLEYICHRKGGTSLGTAILLVILSMAIVTVLTIYLGVKTFVSDILKDFKIDFSSFNITGTVTNEYNENINYYVTKFKIFMDNTDPDPGYTPEISNKELLKVTMPRAKQESDYVGCQLNNRQQGWFNAAGYLFKPGSTDCKSYMQNAEEFISDTIPLPDSALLIFNAKKELGPGTKIDYQDSSCMYNAQKQKFECRKK